MKINDLGYPDLGILHQIMNDGETQWRNVRKEIVRRPHRVAAVFNQVWKELNRDNGMIWRVMLMSPQTVADLGGGQGLGTFWTTDIVSVRNSIDSLGNGAPEDADMLCILKAKVLDIQEHVDWPTTISNRFEFPWESEVSIVSDSPLMLIQFGHYPVFGKKGIALRPELWGRTLWA